MTSTKPYDISKRRVLEAYRHVRANRGAAGIDDESIEMFEADLSRNLYKLWNRWRHERESAKAVLGAALEDGGGPPEVCLQKPASNRLGAAVPKRCGGERFGEKAPLKASGVCREDERKLSVRLGIENSSCCQNRSPRFSAGRAWRVFCLLSRRQPVHRRHELDTGFERGT
jgi:hypothetical protein